MASGIKVWTEWPSVSYCVTSGNIEIARYQRGQDTKQLVIVEITPQEIEKVINDLEVAALFAKDLELSDQ